MNCTPYTKSSYIMNSCLYLLHHTNSQVHVCLIASSVKLLPNVLLLCTDSSQPGWFHVDTYICAFLDCDLPIQLMLKLLSCEYDDRLVYWKIGRLAENRFIMC